jgi:signal transduction histidine kinase
VNSSFRNLLNAGSWKELPGSVYTALFAQLFRGSSLTVSLGEASLIATIGGLGSYRASDPWLLALTLFTCVGVLSLIPIGRHCRRARLDRMEPEQVRKIERRYEVLAVGISLGVGAMAGRAVLASDDFLVHLLLISMMLGATSTVIRYHYRPRIFVGKTLAICLPFVGGACASGNGYMAVLGFCSLMASRVNLQIGLNLYRNAEAALLNVREKEILAAELKIRNSELKQRERQRNEAEARLQEMQAELIHVSRVSAMGTMASTLAHELNQPLTAVTNYVRGAGRLMEKCDFPEKEMMVDAMEAADASASRAAKIVRRLRSLVFRGDIKTAPESVAELIEASCDLGFVDSHIRRVECRLDLDPEADFVDVDSIQIQQVMINLIRNAVEAMDGSERREIIIAAKPVRGEMIEISVSDTGAGLTGTELETLFASFHSTKPQGMGIGLSICRTIIEAHGGRIWAEPRPEGGARFLFTVRRTGATAGAAPVPDTKAA